MTVERPNAIRRLAHAVQRTWFQPRANDPSWFGALPADDHLSWRAVLPCPRLPRHRPRTASARPRLAVPRLGTTGPRLGTVAPRLGTTTPRLGTTGPRLRLGIGVAVVGALLTGGLGAAAVTGGGTGAATATFTNPIKAHGPDPWLTYHEGYYYLATTTWSSNLTMRRSRTLAGLSTAPDQQVWTGDAPARCCNMWAPEFHLLDGPNGKRWYLYYVAGQNVTDYNPTQRLHVLESEGLDPMGPYHYRNTLGNTWQLDANILQLDGRLYLLGTYVDQDQDLFITPMSNPWTTSGARVRLSTPSESWERQTAPVQEAPEVLQHDGRTFLIYSASACWGPDYKLGMLTLTGSDPLNPAHWTKSRQPVFQRNDANGVFAPGHNGFFTSPDGTESWIVYHANDSVGGGCDMNRSTRAQRFTWKADGTPDFGTPVRLGTVLDAPSGEPAG